jgi:coiled-coil domain-containing protein 39
LQEGKLKERKLYIEGGDKQLAKVTTANHEKLVEQSLLQMRIKQLEKHIAKQDDKLYTLEKHKIELDTEMNARELLGKNDDGTMITGTQIKVQAAQEKFLLLKEGNDLNDKVLRAEDDVKAMENTLRLMNYSNESYRRSLDNAEENSVELKELQELQTEYCVVIQQLKRARHTLTTKSQNLEVLGGQREAAEDLAEQMERMRLDSNEILTKVHKELLEQKTKMLRAERELKLVKKSARQKVNDMEFMAAFEVSVEQFSSMVSKNFAFSWTWSLKRPKNEMRPVCNSWPTWSRRMTRWRPLSANICAKRD